MIWTFSFPLWTVHFFFVDAKMLTKYFVIDFRALLKCHTKLFLTWQSKYISIQTKTFRRLQDEYQGNGSAKCWLDRRSWWRLLNRQTPLYEAANVQLQSDLYRARVFGALYATWTGRQSECQGLSDYMERLYQ
jgi:hypothetical protein